MSDESDDGRVSDDCGGGDNSLICSSRLGWQLCFHLRRLFVRAALQHLDLSLLRSFHSLSNERGRRLEQACVQ